MFGFKKKKGISHDLSCSTSYAIVWRSYKFEQYTKIKIIHYTGAAASPPLSSPGLRCSSFVCRALPLALPLGLSAIFPYPDGNNANTKHLSIQFYTAFFVKA